MTDTPDLAPLFIVPMMLAMQAPAADDAEEIAARVATKVTLDLRTMAEIAGQRAGDDGRIFFDLRMCGASPTTEWEWDGNEESLPETLEGLTCDSGSDRSATALVLRLLEQDADKPAPVRLASLLTSLSGWVHQRMALHPRASHAPAEPAEATLGCDELLLHAFARAESKGGAPDKPEWSDLRVAFAAAKAANPGVYESLLDVYNRYRLNPTQLDQLATNRALEVQAQAQRDAAAQYDGSTPDA